MIEDANVKFGRSKKWRGLKLLSALILAGAIFIGGAAVGHYSWKNKTVSGSFDYSSVNKLYDVLQKNFDGNLDKSKLLDGIKHGLVTATGDPYTLYFNSKEAKDFHDELSGSFTGIGAVLGSNNGHIVIISPLSGYPAAKAGLKPKDIVAAVDGKSTSGLSIDQVTSKIRGPANTKVKLTLIRDNGQPFDVTITRTTIKIPSVEYKVEGQFGYLKISQFSDDTSSLATKAANSFKAKKVKGVVLDLRGDPGGYLSAAINVSSLWLDNCQKVVQEKRGGHVESTGYANSQGGDGSGMTPADSSCSANSQTVNVLKGLPTVVLIDGGSASASEITSGALHDNKAATLMGEKSFGKGSVQQVECLDITNLDGSCQGDELKVTVARWYTPDGINIDKQGLKPDVEVKLSDSDIKAGRDTQKQRAYDFLQQKLH